MLEPVELCNLIIEQIGGRAEAASGLETTAKIPARFSVGDLRGLTVLLTAGPTREALDPVRFISNRSTGQMGFAVAAAAAAVGARVVLISGPVGLKTPCGVNRIDVESALDMHAAVMSLSLIHI